MPSFMGFWNAFLPLIVTHATGTFINHRGHGCFSQVGCALAFPAAVDQPDPAHIAVGNLVPGQVDRMVCGQFIVNQFTGFAMFGGVIASVIGR